MTIEWLKTIRTHDNQDNPVLFRKMLQMVIDEKHFLYPRILDLERLEYLKIINSEAKADNTDRTPLFWKEHMVKRIREEQSENPTVQQGRLPLYDDRETDG